MGMGKPARAAKRSATSSFSTISTVLFVAFCVLGVYMLTSSSLLGGNGGGGRSAPTRASKFISEPPPVGEEEPEPKRPVIEEVTEEKRAEIEQTETVEPKEEEPALETNTESEPTLETKTESEPAKISEEEVEIKNEEINEQKSEGKSEETPTEETPIEETQAEEKSDKTEEVTTQSEEEEKVTSETFSDTSHSDTNVEDATDASESASESDKKIEKEESDDKAINSGRSESGSKAQKWFLCNTTAGFDYIPCLDNEEAIKKLHRRHYEHRERHCPEEPPTCLVPSPEGYKQPVEWPTSREKIWYHNVPHTKLAVVKGHQNWVKVTGEYLTFPGGGTQFIHGALHYIDFLRQAVPKLSWGKHTRVILDVGCGVASFGGFLFERDVLAMSFAPKDEHEAQVQFALERGIPAISAVMGTQRLLYPSNVFDAIHCARCRVPWHIEGGMLLLELNRLLRPGGYFLWSATPVYQKLQEDVEIWNAMKSLTQAMCWDLITIKKDKLNGVGAAIFRKPMDNECYQKRKQAEPPMCKEDDDPNAAWYVPLQACMHRIPEEDSEQGSEWPADWPRRLRTPPRWLNSSQTGVYGKPAPADFKADHEHWKQVVSKSYLSELGIDWSNVRNVMDMKAVYGGFAAALNDLTVWVMNVVNVDSPDTLPIIYDRGLFGIYHDWCESFSTYPRTYDLLHADHLFSGLKKRCNLVPVIVEVDRILRPGGKLIVRDEPETISEVEGLLKSLHWEIRMTFNKGKNGMLSAQKMDWRPSQLASQ